MIIMKHKQTWKVKASILALLFCMMCMLGCGKSSTSNEKTLRVGTNAEFPPFEYINNSGEIDGFDIQLIKAVGEEMGYQVEIQNMEFKSLLGSLKSGALDAVIAGMTVTDERRESVDFTTTYYTATQHIIVTVDSDITSLEQLNGKKIAVQEGTTGDLLVTPEDDNEIITDKNTEVKRFKKGTDAIIELKNGSVDAVVIDANPAKEFVRVNEGVLKNIEITDIKEEYAIAVSKGNEQVVDDINEGIRRIKENGVFDELVETYINGTEKSVRRHSDNPFIEFLYTLEFVFISTNGYKLLLQGLVATIGISLAAVLVGIVLGLLLALMKMTEVQKGKKTLWSRLASIYIDIIRGTPAIVQLLIMYMVVFQSKMGMVAAILTFGINSAAYVAEIIRAGILAVDKGQMEGGRSLGFSYAETMRYIILPQAIKNILPALGNEFITLIKETAIVGYVAIQDLTKAADFIISRTYETFLPLIAIAIIYYCLVKLLTKGLNVFERRLRQSDIR